MHIQDKLANERSDEIMIYEEAKKRSEQYAEALELDGIDERQWKAAFEDGHGPVYVVGGERVAIELHHVCGAYYGDEWSHILLAVAEDGKLNQTVGNGTRWVCLCRLHAELLDVISSDISECPIESFSHDQKYRAIKVQRK